MSAFRTVRSQTLLEEAFLRLERRTVATPDGSTVDRVVVVHPGAVAVVPLIGDDVLLFRQHRVPVERALLEIPAGKLDVPGEDPRDTAARELEEEIGYAPGRLDHLTDLLTTPGFSDECIHIYAGYDLTPVAARPTGIEEHHAEIVQMPLTEAVALARSGAITDAKTIVGLLLAEGR
ncbi:MAG: NUDIX hydrolase [Actinomycetota bacterium]